MIPHTVRPGWQFRDHEDVKVADWIRPYTPEASLDAALLGVPLSKTSISHSAAFRLPAAVRAAFMAMTPYSVEHALDLREHLNVLDIGDVEMHLTDLALCHRRIEEAVAGYAAQHAAPLIVMGGDHSLTACAVAGFVRAGRGRMGILHFDAHHDLRNTADGGRHNGTPFRTIVEAGWVRGEDIVQLGLRDFVNAPAHHAFALRHGVTVISARRVRREGLLPLVQAAHANLLNRVDAIYVSFDLDALDPAFAPGVPAPAPGGLTLPECMEALEWISCQGRILALDVVCADPAQDVRDLTSRTAAFLILSFLTGLALRRRDQAGAGNAGGGGS